MAIPPTGTRYHLSVVVVHISSSSTWVSRSVTILAHLATRGMWGNLDSNDPDLVTYIISTGGS